MPITIWTEQNRPENDPLWERQVQLESDMLTIGADTFRATVNKAKLKEQMSDLAPYRKLMARFIVPMTDSLADWRDAMAHRRGPKPIAFKLLEAVPNEVQALVGLRATLDRMATGTAKFLSLAFNIGTALEHEARMIAWQIHDPDLWEAVQFTLDKQKATSVHRRRVNINRFNAKVRESEGFQWTDWTPDQKQHVGFLILDHMITATKRFSIVNDPDWERPQNGKARLEKPPKVVVADPELVGWLEKAIDREELFHPYYMPTLIPPAPWTNLKDGGYHTDLLPKRLMIRFKADHEEQRRRAIEDLSNVEMPDVYDALNAVQNVGWKINEKVYKIAMTAWERDLAIAGMPRQTAEELPWRPPELDQEQPPEAMLKEWKIKASQVYGRNARRISHVIKSKRSLVIAERYVGETFYFPHVLDFRGRMYPIPVELQPQGDDLARGLLTFAEGKPVDQDAARWLAIQLCNTFGNDKVPFDERVDWTWERNALWEAIANDPLGVRDWTQAEEPWQHLAAIFEWVRWLREGEGMISSLPIRIDGTCNGIQHLSAMVLDEVGGAAVNLTPGTQPRDIYKEVGVLVQYDLEEREANGDIKAATWLNAVKREIPRKLTKRPVMVLPYGGTRDAYYKYVSLWMRDNDRDMSLFGPDFAERRKLARYMVNILWDVVNRVLIKARQVQKWLQTLAKKAAASGAPIFWQTPIGFVVRHFYGHREMVQIETKVDGQRLRLTNWKTTANLDVNDQVRGVAPNFTHSMDACALMESVLLALHNGVSSITTIHDAYGTVAADVDQLNACLRHAFVSLYKDHDILGLYETGIRQLTNEELPVRPTPGNLDLESVKDSTYFFA